MLGFSAPAQHYFNSAVRLLRRLSQRTAFSTAALAALSLGLILLLTAWRGAPRPAVHDEFAYLLQADTFAHGRLTNPTPAAWEHFETMHVLMTPTYQAKYPPGQGLALALGQVLFGRPMVGIWVVTVAAVLAIWWSLRPWVGRCWALWGGLVAAIHPQILEWSQTFWGGNLALLGGALLLGGAGRLARPGRHKVVSAAIASTLGGLGIMMLAFTRPYEGLVLTLLLGVWLALARRRWGSVAAASVLPAALILLVGLSWLGYYNFRVTGSAMRLPYVEHQAQYGALVAFQSLHAQA